MESKTMSIIVVVVVIVAAIAGYAGYTMAPRGPEEADIDAAYDSGYDKGFVDGRYPKGVLKIGITGPMTGVLASEGEDFLEGLKFATEEINEMGGIIGYKVELVVGDVEDFEAAKINAIYEKLINQDKVAAILTSYGNPSQIELDICAKYDMIYMQNGEWMTTQDKWEADPEKYKTCFNTVAPYTSYRTELPMRFQEWVDEGLIDVINNKISIVYSDNYFSSWIAEGLAENFEDMGWEINLWEMVPFGAVTEWGPILAKIRADPPALVINTDYIPSNEAAFVEQFLENPTESHLFIQYAPSTAEFLELLGDKCTGILGVAPDINQFTSGNVPGEELRQKFIDHFGIDPGGIRYRTYEKLWIYKQAVEHAHADYGAEPWDTLLVARALRLKTAYTGCYSPLIFNEKNCFTAKFATPYMYQIWDIVRNTISPEPYATHDARNPPWMEG